MAFAKDYGRNSSWSTLPHELSSGESPVASYYEMDAGAGHNWYGVAELESKVVGAAAYELDAAAVVEGGFRAELPG